MGYAFVGLDKLHNDIYPAISAAQTPALKQPGKVVLVTGASRGIGRAIAVQYAHAGVATIILVARTAAKLEEVKKEVEGVNKDVKVRIEAADVTSEESVKALAERVEKEEGRLDVLVNVSPFHVFRAYFGRQGLISIKYRMQEQRETGFRSLSRNRVIGGGTLRSASRRRTYSCRHCCRCSCGLRRSMAGKQVRL